MPPWCPLRFTYSQTQPYLPPLRVGTRVFVAPGITERGVGEAMGGRWVDLSPLSSLLSPPFVAGVRGRDRHRFPCPSGPCSLTLSPRETPVP
jgi:hypothetical protein